MIHKKGTLRKKRSRRFISRATKYMYAARMMRFCFVFFPQGSQERPGLTIVLRLTLSPAASRECHIYGPINHNRSSWSLRKEALGLRVRSLVFSGRSTKGGVW